VARFGCSESDEQDGNMSNATVIGRSRKASDGGLRISSIILHWNYHVYTYMMCVVED